MRATKLLVATAVLSVAACAKSDQKPVDSATPATQAQARSDTTAVATTSSVTTVTPAVPVAEAPTTATTTTKTTTKTTKSTTAATPVTKPAATQPSAAATQATTKPSVAPPVTVTPPVAVPPTPKPEVKPDVAAAAPGSALPDTIGKVAYEANCRKCHGVRGVPPKTMVEKFPKIVTFDAAFFAKHSADSIITILTKGKNEDMKSFKAKLSHDEMVAVAAYMRGFAK